MAQGSFPGDPSEAEKARYRRKLAEWRAMGFDVSALEVLLETDFEKFKQMRFELMRSQIHGAGPAASAGPDRSPASVPGQPPIPARRPGLHSHFFRPPQPPEEARAPRDVPAQHERIHSEMRYPSARRSRPDRSVRTFSVEVERGRDAGRIVVAGTRPSLPAIKASPPKKAAKAAPRVPATVPRRRPQTPQDEELPEVAVEEAERPDEGPEMTVEEQVEPEELQRQAAEEDEQISVEEESGEPPEGGPEQEEAGEQLEPPKEEAPSGEEVAEEGEETPIEEGPRQSLGYFTPASRVPMKPREKRLRPTRGEMAETGEGRAPPVMKKKLKKVAMRPRPVAPGRRPPYGWISVAVVVMLVIAGYAGYGLLTPRTTLTARAFLPETAESGALVIFDGANSSSTGKGIARYDWIFGDGARGTGKRITHVYSSPGTNTVTLTVQDQDGTRSAPYRSSLTVSALSVSVPPKKYNDRASYAVNGTVDIRNPDSYLYKINVGGQQVTVSEVQLNLTGTLSQWVRDQHSEEDGFGVDHSALWTTSNEALSIFGRAFTNALTVPINGDLNYFEDSYSDAATGAVFQVQSRARTSLRLSSLPAGPTSINSTDSLRAYPGVAGMPGQFLPDNIYKGRTFSQTKGQANGTHRSGNVTYFWTQMGIRNIGGMASLGLNITAEKPFLDQNGLSEFYINLWISGSSSMPTSTLVHVVGNSGDTSYSADHLTTITEFKAGTGAIDLGAQVFNKAPLPPGLFSLSFADVPGAGSGNSSLRFSPGQAMQEAAARDGSFSEFLAQNPQAYAVVAKYFEGQFGPGSATWNLTFSWPGAASSYWVNVTRDILQQYTVRGSFDGGLTQVKTPESALASMLTMSSAEGRMRDNDTLTATTFFQGGAVNWAGGTSLELASDPVYPGINLASIYASGERAGYGVMLKKEGYTSAFSMDTGQMMYFYTHSSL